MLQDQQVMETMRKIIIGLLVVAVIAIAVFIWQIVMLVRG